MTTMERVREHYEEAKTIFDERRIVGIFLYGSQNYGLDSPESDVDTKCIVLPTFEEICFNKKPVSYTHVRANDEHIEFKDIRLMLREFRKQNMNFVEILFTQYCIVNPFYAEYWGYITEHCEEIARYRPVLTVKTMAGMANEKRHALCHPYPAKLEVLAQFGYDPKQLTHQIRILNFIRNYKAGKPYAECMLAGEDGRYLRWVKAGNLTKQEAIFESDAVQHFINVEVDDYVEKMEDTVNPNVDYILDNAQRLIVAAALRRELDE